MPTSLFTLRGRVASAIIAAALVASGAVTGVAWLDRAALSSDLTQREINAALLAVRASIGSELRAGVESVAQQGATLRAELGGLAKRLRGSAPS